MHLIRRQVKFVPIQPCFTVYRYLIIGGSSVSDLLMFWTGWEVMPGPGDQLVLSVEKGRPLSSLPESKACFNKLIVSPHKEYSTLRASLLPALKHGEKGYAAF